jgi:cation:H+ antiporter
MMMAVAWLTFGFVLLLKGADLLIDGATSFAHRYGLSMAFIGMTVVAFGTSAPELMVSTIASIEHAGDIAIGNVIGSNIANAFLVLGVSALFAPLIVTRSTVTKEIPFSLLALTAVFFMANDRLFDGADADRLSRIDGAVLVLFFSIFIYYTFGIARVKETLIEKTVGTIVDDAPKDHSVRVSGVLIVAGLAGLTVGGRTIAALAGLSEALVGLTVVAIGTSLPELAASVVAARKGKQEIAIGNVVGSNIFNLLWVLGWSAVIGPLSGASAFNADLAVLGVGSALLVALIYSGKRNILAKREGAALVALYIGYLAFRAFVV